MSTLDIVTVIVFGCTLVLFTITMLSSYYMSKPRRKNDPRQCSRISSN